MPEWRMSEVMTKARSLYEAKGWQIRKCRVILVRSFELAHYAPRNLRNF